MTKFTTEQELDLIKQLDELEVPTRQLFGVRFGKRWRPRKRRRREIRTAALEAARAYDNSCRKHKVYPTAYGMQQYIQDHMYCRGYHPEKLKGQEEDRLPGEPGSMILVYYISQVIIIVVRLWLEYRRKNNLS